MQNGQWALLQHLTDLWKGHIVWVCASSRGKWFFVEA